MTIELGTRDDIDGWMRLVETVKDAFPGLETQEALDAHRHTVLDFMGRDGAICAKEQGEIVGALLFSRETNVLCFLAVDAEHRRQHIAEKWYPTCLRGWSPGVTYRLRPIGKARPREPLRGHSIREWALRKRH